MQSLYLLIVYRLMQLGILISFELRSSYLATFTTRTLRRQRQQLLECLFHWENWIFLAPHEFPVSWSFPSPWLLPLSFQCCDKYSRSSDTWNIFTFLFFSLLFHHSFNSVYRVLIYQAKWRAIQINYPWSALIARRQTVVQIQLSGTAITTLLHRGHPHRSLWV